MLEWQHALPALVDHYDIALVTAGPFGPAYQLIGQSSTNVFTVSGLEPATQYKYAVRAVNDAQVVSTYSTIVTVETPAVGGDHALTFPTILTENGWTTRLGIVNPHPESARMYLSAYGKQGQLLASVQEALLGPHARLYRGLEELFDTLKQNQLAEVAWVRVTSDRQLHGFTEYNAADGQRKMFAEAVMSPANRLYIPHIAAEMPELWWTQAGLIAGVGASSKSLRLGTGGQHPISDLDSDNSQMVLDLNSYFPSAPGSGEAVGECRSSETDLGGVVMFGRSDSVQVASALTMKSLPTRTLFYSHVAQDAVWWTGFTIYNVSSQTAHITVYGYDEAGHLTGQNQVEVPAKVKRVAFVGDFIGANPMPAYAVMQSDQPVIGFELFGGQGAPIMAGINADSVTSKTLFFSHVQLNEGEWTGITMINPGEVNAAITVYGYDDAGQVVATSTALLGPHQKWVRFVQDLFGGAAPATLSHLRVESDQPLTGFELVGDYALTRLDGLPATASAYATDETTVTASGATLSVGEADVEIPAGAIPAGTIVSLSERPLDYFSDGETQLLGNVSFSLEPEGLEASSPLTITLPLTESVYQKLVADKARLSDLTIYRWNTLLQYWEEVPTTVVLGALVATVPTLGLYAMGYHLPAPDISITMTFDVRPTQFKTKGWLIIKKPPKFGLIERLGSASNIYTQKYLPYMQHAGTGVVDSNTLATAYLSDLNQPFILDESELLKAMKGQSLWCFFVPTTDSSNVGACAAAGEISFWTVSVSEAEYDASQNKRYRVIVLTLPNQTTHYQGYFGAKTHFNAIAIDEPVNPQSIPGKDPILLVHGINGTAEYWGDNIQNLRDNNVNTYALFHMGWETIPNSAEMVKAALDYVRSRHSNSEVDVITHSYGGVITRYYCLETEPTLCGGKIDDLVMIAPPHHGSLAAAKCVFDDPLVIFQRLHLGNTNDPNLPIYAELTPGSGHLLTMGKRSFPAGLNPLILAGAEAIGGLTLVHTEGLLGEDGMVSVPSASLLDATSPVKLGIIELNHLEQPTDAELFETLSDYLIRTTSPGFPIGGDEVVRYLWSSWGDVVEDTWDGMLFNPYQAFLVIDARTAGAGIDSVVFDANWTPAFTDLDMTENPINPGVYFYWAVVANVDYGPTIDLQGSVSRTCTLHFLNSSGTAVQSANDVPLHAACTTLKVQSGGQGTLWATDSIVGDLMYVPAGTFTQGAPTSEPCRKEDQTQFTHTLTQNLAVMATEVTQGMWEALKAEQSTLPSDPSYFDGADRPVEDVTWYEAVLFANLLSVEQGLTRCYYKDAGFTQPVTASNYTTEPFYCNFNASGYRLLTEGEWEYCCRAGTTTPFWIAEPNYTSGNCSSCTFGLMPNLESAAVFCANDPGATSEVATKLPNPWGLYDTHGNVWEWCWDWYGKYPTGSATNHPGAGSGSYRVIRGGGWHSYAVSCRSAVRYSYDPGYRYSNLGFRLARGL